MQILLGAKIEIIFGLKQDTFIIQHEDVQVGGSWRPLMSGFLPCRILTYEKLPRWRKCHRYLKEKTVSASCFFCWRGTLLVSQLAFFQFQHPPFSSILNVFFPGPCKLFLEETASAAFVPRKVSEAWNHGGPHLKVFFFLRWDFTNIPVEHPEVFDTDMLGESSWSDPKTSSYHI